MAHAPPFSPQALCDIVTPIVPLTKAGRWWVAYSGGCDSHVLLHALSQLRPQLDIQLGAVYVNHGLSPNAAAWGDHCRRATEELGIEFRLLEVDARPQAGESPEAAARRARYRALEGLLQEDDLLLTAHHQDDQAETLLLQLLRGAGPKGLAAMPFSSALGQARLYRPLLGFDREQLYSYAHREGLTWIEDESNLDTGFNRNYLRHEVMPLFKQRWPALARTLSRSADHCAEAAVILDEVAAADLASARRDDDSLAIAALQALTPARQRNLLRYWIAAAGFPLPSEARLNHVLTDVVAAREDAMPCVAWQGVELRRYRGALYRVRGRRGFSVEDEFLWQIDRPLALPDGRRLVCRPAAAGESGLGEKYIRQGKVKVAFRRGGERIRPAGSAHHKRLKQLLQERDIPPWEREGLPLLYVDGVLAAVVGLCVDQVYLAVAGEAAIVITIE